LDPSDEVLQEWLAINFKGDLMDFETVYLGKW
jgi:hypothetical protein